MMLSEERKASVRQAWRACCEAQERTNSARAEFEAATDAENAAGRAFSALGCYPGELTESRGESA